MTHTAILNFLIEKFSYLTYLEIGVRNPKANFDKIKIRFSEGVDPAGKCAYPMPSDKFFLLYPHKRYDIIFIDGLHEEKQVDKDIQNSLKALELNGTIVVHDCNPPTAWHQRPASEFKGNEPWNGTVWRSYAKLRMTDASLSMCCIDSDWGVGIIRKGKQVLFPAVNPFGYELLEQHRKELLNLVSPDEFKKIL
jgi:hypothetical protein